MTSAPAVSPARITGLLAMSVFAGLAMVGVQSPAVYDDIGSLLRLTARAAALLFLLAFVATALARVLPSGVTARMAEREPYLFLAFAATHFLHLGVIAGTAWYGQLHRDNLTQWLVTLIGGGLAYLLILLMATSAFDLRSGATRTLHAVGMYYVWLVFFQSNFGRARAGSKYHALVAALAVGALMVRVTASLVRRPKPASSAANG
jgi:methionine sulfoxide reductase heme-binding subunit